MEQKLIRPARVLAVLALAAAAAVYTVCVALAGGSAVGLWLYGLAFLLCILLPGLYFCGKAMPGLRGVALVPVAAVCGAAGLMLCYVLFGAVGLPRLSGLPMAALGLYGLFTTGNRVRPGLRAVWQNTQLSAWVLVLLVAALAVTGGVIGVLTIAKPHIYGQYNYSQDTLWSIGNAAAVQWDFPLRDIRSVSGVMHYHYFTDAVCGLLALFSGQSAWDALCYFNWPVWMAMLMLALWALCRRLGAGGWQALLGPVSAALLHGGYFSSYVHFFYNPNGVLQSYVYLVVCLLLLAESQRAGVVQQKRALAPVVLAALALVWGKSTIGLLLLLAMISAFVVYWLLHRRAERWLLAAIGCVAAVFGVLALTLLSGGLTQVELRPTAASFLEVLQILIGQCWPVFVPYLLALVYGVYRLKRMSYTALVIHAMALGGLPACAILFHYGGSQYYFLLTSIFLMWICVVEAMAALPKQNARRAAGVVMAVCALAAFLPNVSSILSGARGGLASVLDIEGNSERYGYSLYTVSAEDEEAALWLKENMELDEVFATNRHNKMELGADGIFHFYTAVSQRQCYMEGWQYALDYSTEYWTMRYQLETVSDGIFDWVSYEEASEIAREHGISYLLVHKANRYERPLEGGVPVFENRDVWIYKVE